VKDTTYLHTLCYPRPFDNRQENRDFQIHIGWSDGLPKSGNQTQVPLSFAQSKLAESLSSVQLSY